MIDIEKTGFMPTSNIFMKSLLINGDERPNSVRELKDLFSKIDLKKSLKNTELIEDPILGNSVISFDTLENSRLFFTALGLEGSDKKMFEFYLDAPFKDGLLNDYRINSGQFYVSEKKGRIDRTKTIQIIGLKYGNEDDYQKYTNLIRNVISETMPHLAGEITNMKLTTGGIKK